MNKRKNAKSIRILSLVIIFLMIASSILTSTIFARYLTSDSSASGTRVAKWNIDFSDGTSFNSVISSTHLEAGSSGEWGLDIANKSETAAKFADDSSVKIRLQSPDFNIDHVHDSWDFLVDNEHNPIDNPINFKAIMYNCSLAELTEANGDLTNIRAVEIFNTKDNSDELHFDMVIDEGELYFECIVNVGSKLNENNDFLLNIFDGKACLKIFWDVEKMLDFVNTNSTFKSYYLVEESKYSNTEYDGKNDDVITINSVRYVIAYKQYDYFEYLIYTSSLGGEIMITFKDELGKNYLKRCTKLSDVEKNSLLSRTLDNTSLEKVKEYLELLEYKEFNNFLQTKSDYNEITGYLSLGLECRLILNIKVEQVD